jgi:uncharacterized protein
MSNETHTPEKNKAPSSWLRVSLALFVCLGIWLLLSAPRLEHSASASPDGLRRTVALSILRPAARFSEAIGLADATDAIETALGKDPDAPPGGELDLEEELAGEELPPLPPEEVQPPREEPRPSKKKGDHKQSPRDTPLRRPSERYRLRVAVVGDSLAQGVGDAMRRSFRSSLVHVLDVGRLATGLARADYFDWVAAMDKISKRYDPDVVVVMVGSNDKQSVVFPNGRGVVSGDPDWGAAYRQRIADFLGATKRRAHVVWVGLPPVKDRGKSRLFRVYNDMYRDVLQDRRDARFIDIWDTFADSEGDYRAYGRGPNGKVVLLRAGDGAHFSVTGYEMIVDLALQVMQERWDMSRKVLR